VYEDWDCALRLLELLEEMVHAGSLDAAVMFVDDGSTTTPDVVWPERTRALQWVSVLRLRRNVGHQRAIALGLTYIRCRLRCERVVVMDGDGEDAPADVPLLLDRAEKFGGRAVVFARRARRSEGLVFRTFYQLYRVLFRTLTGRGIRVGNFSVVPAPLLERLVCVPELWNHYAASLSKARVPCDQIPIARGRRLAGRSRMNFAALVIHGLSAISVFGEEVGLRLLLASLLLCGTAAASMVAVLVVRFFTDLAIPGWATSAFGLLSLLFVHSLLLSVVFVFLVLQARSNMAFLPLRDYSFYVQDWKQVARHD
jgi:hypothetical protein